MRWCECSHLNKLLYTTLHACISSGNGIRWPQGKQQWRKCCALWEMLSSSSSCSRSYFSRLFLTVSSLESYLERDWRLKFCFCFFTDNELFNAHWRILKGTVHLYFLILVVLLINLDYLFVLSCKVLDILVMRTSVPLKWNFDIVWKNRPETLSSIVAFPQAWPILK